MTPIISSPSCITLLTDFGDQDSYVGAMKGAIACIHPSLMVIDLTHQIPPQDLTAARFHLMNAVPYFPAGTVHLAVVDPGVGSQRRGIAVQLSTGFLVGPDNGIFSGVLHQNPAQRVVELTQTQYWRSPHPSSTFHGRDIFAPVAAHLARGVPIQQVGQPIDPASLVQLEMPSCQRLDNRIEGVIQYIDRFGNLITNIPGQTVEGQAWHAVLNDAGLPGNRTYADVDFGNGTALIGSHGWVEIAVRGGSARTQFDSSIGTPVQVVLCPLRR